MRCSACGEETFDLEYLDVAGIDVPYCQECYNEVVYGIIAPAHDEDDDYEFDDHGLDDDGGDHWPEDEDE